MSRPTVGSLFSGIGGLDLGLERAGWEVRWQCEVDDYCSRVLKKHWPDVPNLGDVTEVDWNGVERVDLICGGYPCQPFSFAGARKGTDDERHLWPYFRDAVRVLRPRLALLENVPGHLSLGFGTVLADLAALGYDTEWDCIPAAAVGAPHLRYRLFVVAHAAQQPSVNVRGVERDAGQAGGGSWAGPVQQSGRPSEVADADGKGPQRQWTESRLGGDSCEISVGGRGSGPRVPDSDSGRLEERAQLDSEPLAHSTDRDSRRRHTDRLRNEMADTNISRSWFGRTEPSRWAVSERVADWWAVEPDVGRVAYGIPRRVDRLRGLGNAVVPQVAEFIGGQLLEACERVG